MYLCEALGVDSLPSFSTCVWFVRWPIFCHHCDYLSVTLRQIELEEEEAALDTDDDAAENKGGSRMLRDEVTPDDIASVVASWTGDFLRMLGTVSGLYSVRT